MTRQKHNYNLKAFLDENDISYYLLGAFMTDGCIQKNGTNVKNSNSFKATITSKDLNWIETIRDNIAQTLPINNKAYNALCITNNNISNWLISKGCVPNKSLILEMPNVPDIYFFDFLRGCFDGDGSFCKYKTKKNKEIIRGYLCSSSYNFLNELHYKLALLNINHSFFEVIKKPCKINNRIVVQKNKHYRVAFADKHLYKLLKLMYYPGHKISMPRKYTLANNIINQFSEIYDCQFLV